MAASFSQLRHVFPIPSLEIGKNNMSSSPSSGFLVNNGGLNWTPNDVPAFDVAMAPHDKHPSLTGLAILVFEAVLEVICVSLPG